VSLQVEEYNIEVCVWIDNFESGLIKRVVPKEPVCCGDSSNNSYMA
jgi:hypothetical protein